MRKFRLFLAALAAASLANASALDYALIKKGEPSSNTMLLIGGIQGDEPGGFLAASIVATDYNITKGSLWVVPNLNFPSIIERSRGTKGDMNRKFAHVEKDDPDYNSVMKIKDVIIDKNVTLILNLHDGSGYYRDKFISKDENPDKWGNTCIIDQSTLPGSKYPELESIASSVKDVLNKHLIDPKHQYHVKNTHTAMGDKEMLKSLTYYAITQNKSAFANEASKNLNAEQRTYYHLVAIEEYIKKAGIGFTRPFELDVKSVKKAIEKEIRLELFDSYALSLKNLKPVISFVPFKKGELSYHSPNPLIAVIKDNDTYKVQYGNRSVTRLKPQYFEFAKPLDKISLLSDGKELVLKSGDKFSVKKSFKVKTLKNVRVNVIGYGTKSVDESEQEIDKNSLNKSYSIDKDGKIYRVEFYKSENGKEKFAGMILAEFR